MNIEKLKAEFEQSECFKRLEHVAQYTFFEFGAYCKRTDVPTDIEKKYGKLITALLFSWGAWKEAQAVPEGFVLVPKKLNHEQAVKISDDENFFETYQTILAESDTSEDSAVILIQTAHKAMIEAQEPVNDSR